MKLDYEFISEAAVFGTLTPDTLSREGGKLKQGKTWDDVRRATTIQPGGNIGSASFEGMVAIVENQLKEVIEPSVA